MADLVGLRFVGLRWVTHFCWVRSWLGRRRRKLSLFVGGLLQPRVVRNLMLTVGGGLWHLRRVIMSF
ncbi:hypothetical protein LOK49_LG02G01177 [Camellia lanceoleosa]|uniref:Uncharacterized protein n=1 Tax=Camellia lanceoleosa TaxID=1840588 RepID=A0ACC0IKB8_9ERIC|nr:hypothetical protein LOK49_LG02G01177 [Camellia lanceoleosa]